MKTKAAVLETYGTPLVIDELELDGPREKEVLIEYKAAGLCHSDLSILKGILRMPPLPCVAGHEGAGVVKEVGPGVTRVKPDDHVLAMWVPTCGQCYYCLRGQPYLCAEKDKARAGTMLDGTYRLTRGGKNMQMMMGVGTFSQYNVLNELSVTPIDADIPFEVASITGCAVMTGVGAVLKKAKVAPGSSVAVIGIGGIGINVIQGAVLANATKIIAIDLLDNKLEWARQFGATHTINSSKEDPVEKVLALTGGIGADYAFEAIGLADTAVTTYKLVRRGGDAVFLGVPGMEVNVSLPQFQFPLMEKSALGSYYGSGNLRVDLITLLDLFKAGRLKLAELITSRYSLEDINTGFADMEAGKNIRGVIMY